MNDRSSSTRQHQSLMRQRQSWPLRRKSPWQHRPSPPKTTLQNTMVLREREKQPRPGPAQPVPSCNGEHPRSTSFAGLEIAHVGTCMVRHSLWFFFPVTEPATRQRPPGRERLCAYKPTHCCCCLRQEPTARKSMSKRKLHLYGVSQPPRERSLTGGSLPAFS